MALRSADPEPVSRCSPLPSKGATVLYHAVSGAVAPASFAADPPPLVHTQLDQIQASVATDLLQNIEAQTPWTGLQLVDLVDGQAIGATSSEEVTMLLLEGQGVTATGDGLQAPAAVVTVADSRAFTSAGAARVLSARVEMQNESAAATHYDRFDAQQLTWRDSIHGGSGRIATRHLWRPEDFAGDGWVFVDHAILGEDSSLGHHYHGALEEAFVVLKGKGWMTMGDSTFEVGPGSVTFQPVGVGHGLYNPFEEELDFVRLAVGIPGETFTTIDLDSDLRNRRPGDG